MKVPLEQWASSKWSPTPKIKTLRRWAREAKIVPVPKKVGRTYYVEEDARYVNWNDLNGSEETQRG